MSEPGPRSVAVVTPWYPTADRPFAGAFIQAMVEATAPGCDTITVYHTDSWRMPDATALESAADAHRKLLPRALRPEPTVAGAELWRVPVPDPVPTGGSFAERARHHADWLRVALGGTPLPAAVVHAHVGLRGGWTALENARQGAPVFVTEHASYLTDLLDQPDSRDLYEEVLARAPASSRWARESGTRSPRPSPSTRTRSTSFPTRSRSTSPGRVPLPNCAAGSTWATSPSTRGAHLLLEAFATCRAEDPGLTLTLVGTGKLADSLRRRTAALDLDEAVTLAGALPPDQTLRLMRDHDLLVHPSRGETFGMSIVEAVAAGLPVLVTRCGGPETTLAGVEDAAGQMIAVDDAPETIAAGYRRLRERFPEGLDLAKARRVLGERYRYQVVAEAHYRHWFQETATAGRRQA